MINWTPIDNQNDLDELDESICWDDCTVMEWLYGGANLPNLPEIIVRPIQSGGNLYVLIRDSCYHGPNFIEVAFLACDQFDADSLRYFDLRGIVSPTKGVQLIKLLDDTLHYRTRLWCARMAYRRLNKVDETGHHYLRFYENEANDET